MPNVATLPFEPDLAMRPTKIFRTLGPLLIVASMAAGRADAQAGAAAYPAQIAPIVAKYCSKCHGATRPRGGLDLASARDEAAVLKNLKGWQKALEDVEGGTMPRTMPLR